MTHKYIYIYIYIIYTLLFNNYCAETIIRPIYRNIYCEKGLVIRLHLKEDVKVIRLTRGAIQTKFSLL